MKSLWPACAALAVIAVPAAADSGTATSTEVSALRREIDRLRTDYEARLNALEQRLLAVQNAAAAPPAPAPPAPAPAGAGANAFNPALSLIVSGRYGRTSLDPARYAIGGFMLPPQAEIGPGTRGLSLAESELGIAASIDPWWAGAAHIALHPDDSLSIEEAYVQTTALGNGLTLKGGRFFSGVGYLNAQHAHAWDFVDAPLAYQAMLGGQYGDDGLQLRWLAPTDLFAEFGAEIGRGRSFPGTDTARNGVGMAALTVHLGGDFGTSQSWRAGVSLLRARAQEQELATRDRTGAAVTNGFSGTTRVWIADAVWKWAPDGNAARRNFKLQAEWLQSRREGTLIYALEQADVAGAYRALQSGWYLQGVWQFMPRWRAGLRTERLDPGEPDYGINAGAFAAAPWRPRKASAMLDYSASEFSRLRLQFADDRARPGLGADRQVFLQYQMSLGAHGAHGF